MSITVSHTSTMAQRAYGNWRAYDELRYNLQTQARPGRTAVTKLEAIGLSAAVAPYTNSARPAPGAVLLTAMIHSMGGAPTSVGSGLYLRASV
ncbi:MAG: hypothetical protein HYX63_18795 [Gammaproteobacteria bacterium]|nr:hypothetical protein [Gammaproteobacteria bacterium]